MQYVNLGNSDVRVSVIGIGAGGYSKLGTAKGGDPENGVRVI